MVFKTKHTEAATATVTLSNSQLPETELQQWRSEALLANKSFFIFLTAERKKKIGLSYLFSHAFSLAPEPPPSRLLWHLFFDPRLNSCLKN